MNRKKIHLEINLKLKVLIVDDELPARKKLRDLLKDDINVEIVGECKNGVEAVRDIKLKSPDLIFLDIKMPEKDGFEVINSVGIENMPYIIFVTAYSRHAIKAFELHALDYLLKPFDRDRFADAVNHAKNTIKQKEIEKYSHRLFTFVNEFNQERVIFERIIVSRRGKKIIINVNDIDWIQASDNYVTIHTGSQSNMLREKISILEKKLNPDKFVRIHRSVIVNVDRIKEFEPVSRGNYEVVLKNNVRLTLTKNYRSKLNKFFPHDF